jgi:hypothetical protein
MAEESENADLELVRRGVEAVLRKPKPDFATINEIYDPEHEWVSRVSGIEGVSRGAGGFRALLADFADTMEWEGTLVECRAIDGGQVMYVMDGRFRGKTSGIDLGERRVASVATVRSAKIVRTESYGSLAEAREAVGLEA